MQKKFDEWNIVKKKVNDKHLSIYVHEREIWWCKLGVNIGSEQDGDSKHFERPVLILKKFNNELVTILPLTTKSKHNKYHFPIKHKGKQTAIILSQIRVISTKRLVRRIKKLNKSTFLSIIKSVKELYFK